ncbi:hypothetical protein KHA80_10280 [Anaerobacillus sp. HL2]|nr:hypothetical protein KHA80_10280 [Anaerobacillus sp. HL2]
MTSSNNHHRYDAPPFSIQGGKVMLFKRKGRIRKTEDERLLFHLEELKDNFINRSELVKKCRSF